MQQRIRKQKKWHELLEKPTVPSIPPKDKQVPQGEDEENAMSSGNEEDFMQKKEQVIQMIQAAPDNNISNNISETGDATYFSNKMNQYQMTEELLKSDNTA